MKKLLFYTIILIISILSCEKDKVTQLTFSLKNLTTLIDKSSDHIKKASPGEIYLNEEDYIIFGMQDAIGGIDNVYLYYNLIEDQCNTILIFPEDFDILSDAEGFMNLAETEIGEAEGYYISYYDAELINKEEEFVTLDELWALVTNDGITVDKMDEIMGLYFYNDFYFMAGGFYDGNYEHFQSMIQIGRQEDLSGKKASSINWIKIPKNLN